MSVDRLFCDKWDFSKKPIDTEYNEASGWRNVDIPHDWLISQVKDLYETSTGWYRRVMNYAKKPGIRTALRFEGVYTDSRVYVNGKLAKEWKYGYTTFEADITDFLNDGENLIAVRADYRAPNSCDKQHTRYVRRGERQHRNARPRGVRGGGIYRARVRNKRHNRKTRCFVHVPAGKRFRF